MADKSFGDFPSRNIVKNPLLSTAVTGLSIEDLTHNAVLLPVSLTQEVITQSDQTKRPQIGSLGNTEHATPKPPAGDANFNVYPLNLPPTTPLITLDTQNTMETQNKNEKPAPTVPKASAKSNDDFDVNEYFARLQGTRYVSAPLNSALKDDKNANLEATEENLEEINLNEPEKADNMQQSLTADIAQNFSQLPTVLPQMASAVFSSFSNMLQTKKSREATPDVSSGYQEVQFERPPEPSQVMAPPPKEPPTLPPSIGTSNYRLPPKKKYAQIPGLTSGENTQRSYQALTQNLPPTNQNIPQYFTPPANISVTSEAQMIVQQSNLNIHTIYDTLTNEDASQSAPNIFVPTFDNTQSQQNTESVKSSEGIAHTIMHNIIAHNIPEGRDSVKDHNVNIFAQSSAKEPEILNQDFTQSSAILPPPPTFANMSTRDSQTNVGRAVLPPSVARRISSNQPIMKQTPIPQMPSFTDKLFTPASVVASEAQSFPQSQGSVPPLNTSMPISISASPSAQNVNFGISPTSSYSLSMSSYSGTTGSSSTISTQNESTFTVNEPSLTTVKRTEVSTTDNSMVSESMPAACDQTSQITEPQNDTKNVNQVPLFFKPTSDIQTSAPLPAMPPMSSMSKLKNPIPPNVFMQPNLSSSSTSSLPFPNPNAANIIPPPPIFLNPNTETKEFPPILSQSTQDPTAGPPKSLPEPPKAHGNMNFRMAKKRPQYYAGPIEGVGAISNTFKQVVPPIDSSVPSSGAFQGAMFTPQTDANQTQSSGYAQPAPFDINQQTAPVYPMAPQTQDYSTAFDLSRPTTESYSEPKQESTGILGSLKSKLSSLDINKIQSTVTTFFDPAYNDTKKEPESQANKVQDNLGYGQSGREQQGQFNPPAQQHSQHSNFDIFVPDMEQAPQPPYSSQNYLYQMQFQNQYNYSQQQQQPQIQDAHNYYQNQGFQGQHNQNQAQNIATYFGRINQDYQTPIGPTIVCCSVSGHSQTSTHQVFSGSVGIHKQQLSNKSSHEDQQYYSAIPTHHLPEQSEPNIQESYSAVPPYVSQDYTPSNLRNISLPDSQSLGGRTDTNSNRFFDVPSSNASYTDSSSSTNLGAESSRSSFGNIERNIPITTNVMTKVTQTIEKTKEKNDESAHKLNEDIKKIQDDKIPEPTHNVDSHSMKGNEMTETKATIGFLDNQSDITSKSQNSSDAALEQKVAKHKNNDDPKQQEIIKSNIQDVMYQLQTNPADFFGTFSQADDVTNVFSQLSIDCKDEKKKNKIIKNYSDIPSAINIQSAHLLGLSNMLADKTKELNDLQTEINNINQIAQEEASVNRDALFNQNASENVKVQEEDNDEVSELNICETCREIEKPEFREREEDLTTQLIENITSPIVLENPVEVPLRESSSSTDERAEFDRSQCAEINHITEETIEVIQVQSATELLESEQKPLDYGWLTQDVSLALKNEDDQKYPLTSLQRADDFSLSVNPNAIGFLNNVFENLTTNLGAELQAEFKSQESSPIITPRQMSIPSAPPEEDDTKSETIDVHSIEQDAKKDFPLFEEFVIEPSDEPGNDVEEDLIDRKDSENAKLDSFTSRVDNYKKKGETEMEDKMSPVFNLNAISPTVPMASYFDTGNYAVDTHYRNSLTSPTAITNTFGSPNQMRVPPGFEEEFQRRFSTEETFGERVNPNFKVVPETSTQTKPIYSPTFSSAQLPSATTTTMTTSSFYSQNLSSTVKLPDFISTFMERKNSVEHNRSSVPDSFVIKDVKNEPSVEKQRQNIPETLPESLFDLTPADNTKSEMQREVPLPDPINFFTASSDPTKCSGEDDQGFNRLASYFSSPAKTEHSKSFFELSQSQDHYRNDDKTDPTKLKAKSNILDDNAISNLQNIPPEQYLANLNLMRDLTSVEKSEVKPEQVVRTVNYFTIEYDSSEMITKVVKKAQISVRNVRSRPEAASGDGKNTHDYAQVEVDTIGCEKYAISAMFKSSHKESKNKDACNTTRTYTFPKTYEKEQHFDILDKYISLPKADGSKSFFELSQGQNHYRQKRSDLYRNEFLKQNIPLHKYFSALNLLRYLTSFQSNESQFEQAIRPVNYFTIEYDNPHFVKEFSRGEPDQKEDLTTGPFENYELTKDDVTMESIVRNCKHCCDYCLGYQLKNEALKSFNAKTCMDNNSEGQKESMDLKSVADRDNKTSISIPFGPDLEEGKSPDSNLTATENRTAVEYTPVKHHWFYRIDIEGKSIWRGFSAIDSKALEDAYLSPDLSDDTVVPTDGGRYDVNVKGRLRFAVYWSDKPSNVRRCSWFYKGTTDARYIPYTESVAEKLEEEYRRGVTTGEWHRRLLLPNNESVVMHGPTVMVHFLQGTVNDTFSTPQQSANRPVRRGADESEIEDVEPSSIDHLLLLCHGVGSACDMRFRNVEEVVDDFRTTSLQLIQSHYKSAFDSGTIGRVEVLPVSWHATLHSGETGVDTRLARITLDSIPKLRSFTNDTVLDVLFYTSPVYSQTIINTVCAELNRIYKLFRERNPHFTGGVSLGGHSLGSVILYDLLCHQPSQSKRGVEKQVVLGAGSSWHTLVKYPRLSFNPTALYALGSPIAIFECIRGVDNLGIDFALPTCSKFFNIFHPYDPIAYRIEPLINPELRDVKPFLIPHHKGRKRMHLELKDTMARVSADIKQKLMESIKNTWTAMWKTSPPENTTLEKVVEEQLEPLSGEAKEEAPTPLTNEPSASQLGMLNGGRRIDYVLQEAPFEMINEYLFAMSSHVCYWESEDTMLLMLREMYGALGVQPDCSLPPPNLSVQRTTTVLTTSEMAGNSHMVSPSTSRGR